MHQLVHGYKKGHSLLAGSCSLPKAALETVTELSDLSGPLPVGATIPSYLVAYPVPDSGFYALGRTWQDTDAPRSGCVITHTLLIPEDAWQAAAFPSAFLRLHSCPNPQSLDLFRQEIALPNESGQSAENSWLNAAEADEFAAKVFSEGLRSVIWFDCERRIYSSCRWPAYFGRHCRGSLYAHLLASPTGKGEVRLATSLRLVSRSLISAAYRGSVT
ncbi:MAG: hypothetical protein R3B90_00245 [Planctomycetaceae bacterium]